MRFRLVTVTSSHSVIVCGKAASHVRLIRGSRNFFIIYIMGIDAAKI